MEKSRPKIAVLTGEEISEKSIEKNGPQEAEIGKGEDLLVTEAVHRRRSSIRESDVAPHRRTAFES